MYNSVSIVNILSKVIMYASLIVFAASLFTAKFIGIEMMGVIQLAFIGLMIVKYLPPLLSPIAQIGMVNGWNAAFNNSSLEM
jgi:hypothetical protein